MSVELREEAGVLPEVISVLVVDHDSTCLTIVSKMLLVSGYEVVTANCAIDALTIAQEREDDLHLILTEVLLPDMGRYELLEKMEQVSKLPVVIMSADDNETSKLGCLFKGAMLYLVKPLTMKSIRNLWQFSFIKGRERTVSSRSALIRVREESVEENESNENKENQSVKNGMQRCQKSKRRDPEKVGRELEGDGVDSTMLKKPKLVWTEQLHNRFLQAIKVLGIDTHPKEILQHMNVPGLRKENISSHLQKFRLSLKREQEAIQRKISRNSFLEDGSVQFSNPQLLRNSSYLLHSGSQFPNNIGIFMAKPPFGKITSSNVGDSCISIATPSPTFLMNPTPPPPPPPQLLQTEEKDETFECEEGELPQLRPPEPPSEDEEGRGRWFEFEREDMPTAAMHLQSPSPEEDGHFMFQVDVGDLDGGIFDFVVKDSNVIFHDEDFDDLW